MRMKTVCRYVYIEVFQVEDSSRGTKARAVYITLAKKKIDHALYTLDGILLNIVAVVGLEEIYIPPYRHTHIFQIEVSTRS